MVMTDLERSYQGIAYIFPGQGSQFVGMGLDLYMTSPSAREVFDQAEMALSFRRARTSEVVRVNLARAKEEERPSGLTLTNNSHLRRK